MNDQHSQRDRDFALDEPLLPGQTEPVDVVSVRADDALIAALSSAEDIRVDDPIDERLAGLLQSWRADVDSEPEPPLIDVDAAMAAMTAPPPAPRRRQSPFGPLATAAAVLVIAFVGLGLAARGAEPGDALFPVTKMLYSDKAKSAEAVATVRAQLQKADEALRSGDEIAALIALEEAKEQLPEVAEPDVQQELAARTNQMLAEATGTATTSSEAPAPPSSVAPTTPAGSQPTTTQPAAGLQGPATTTVAPSVTTTDHSPTPTSAPPPPTTSPPPSSPATSGATGAGGATGAAGTGGSTGTAGTGSSTGAAQGERAGVGPGRAGGSGPPANSRPPVTS